METTARKSTSESPSAPARLDVDASIRSRARTVRSADLARRLERVQILDMASIRKLVQEAVGEAARDFQRTLAAEEKRLLLEEAEEIFTERLKRFRSEKEGLEARTAHLEAELEKARGLLEEERGRVLSAQQFTVSDAGILELERRLGRLLDRAVKGHAITNDLEQEMRAVVVRLLDDEREKISEKAQEAQNDRISLLERKVSRLASTLEETQKERDRARKRAQALEAAGAGPLRNAITGGIDDDDPDREKKLALLKELVSTNKAMYRELAAHGLLPPRQSRAAAEPPRSVSGRSGEPGRAPGADQPDSLLEDELAVSERLGVKKITAAAKAPPPLERSYSVAEEVTTGALEEA